VFLGVYPKPVLDRIEPSVNRVLSRMEEKVDRYNEPDTQAGSGLDLLQIEKSRESAENGDHAGTEVKK
jgi:hypothetical protein